MTLKNNIRDEKKRNTIKTEKQQKYDHYYVEKLIKMNILHVKKYYILIKKES